MTVDPFALVGLVFRARCWIRGHHRWRIPDLLLLAECRDRSLRVRCGDCGCRRLVTGADLHHHRPAGL